MNARLEMHKRRKRDHEVEADQIIPIRKDDVRGHGPIKPGAVIVALFIVGCVCVVAGYAWKGIEVAQLCG